MKSAVLESRPTTPVTNWWFGAPTVLMLVYREVWESNLNILDFHKARLGPPSFTWQGSERRFRVYERDLYRLFVANGYGFSLEVSEGRGWALADSTRERRAKAAVRQYLKDLGLPSRLTP